MGQGSQTVHQDQHVGPLHGTGQSDHVVTHGAEVVQAEPGDGGAVWRLEEEAVLGDQVLAQLAVSAYPVPTENRGD